MTGTELATRDSEVVRAAGVDLVRIDSEDTVDDAD